MANESVTPLGTQSNTPKSTRSVLSAHSLEGDRVRNPAGEDLGKVEELMLDLDSGRIAYVVVSFGGFLGIGDKLFAIPWDAFTIDVGEQEFILDVDRQTLENAPGFDKNNRPDMADSAWASKVHTHYGQKPSWERDFTSAGDYVGDDKLDNTGLEAGIVSGKHPGSAGRVI